jgi:hypothetical protein
VLAAYSRLKFLLDERSLTPADLNRCLGERGRAVNIRTLARLADPDRSLERIDLRAVGAICQVLGVGLDDLIVFAETERTALRSLAETKQRRLDRLMAGHNEGQLTSAEEDELRALVAEAEKIARSNARRLVEHRRMMTASASRRAEEG